MTSVSLDEVHKSGNIKKRVLILLLIATVLTTTAFLSILNSKSVVTEKKTNARLSAPALMANETDNPPGGTLFCEKPIFTIALMIDRSGSVSGNLENPLKYKDSIKLFLDDLYLDLVDARHGTVHVIMFAFGSRSVLQNATNSSGQIITTISDHDSLVDMKTAVDRIFFTNGSWSNDAATLASNPNDPYDIARSYNAGDVSVDPVGMGATNWDDALLSVAEIGKSPKYSSPERGKHIDLALMLTDGQPNVNNGVADNDGNRKFEIVDVANSDHSNRAFMVDTVTELRNGLSGVRPPIDVRGILINAEAETDMNAVFGVGLDKWAKATNFKDDLQDVLDALLASIDTDEECHWEYVTPTVEVRFSSSADMGPGNTFNLLEGGGSSTEIFLQICNNTPKVKLTEPSFSFDNFVSTSSLFHDNAGNPVTELAPAGEPGACSPVMKGYLPALGLGATFPEHFGITVRAKFTPTKKWRLAPDLLDEVVGKVYYPTEDTELNVLIERRSLPA